MIRSTVAHPALLVTLLASCGPKAPLAPPAPARPADLSGLPDYARDLWEDMDPSADACADFYRFACGGWEDTTKLPADRSRWTRSFSEITERNEEWVKSLLESAAETPDQGDADWARLGNLYAACMDEGAINTAGLAPIQAYATEIDGITDLKSLSAVVGKLHTMSIDVFFGGGVEGDFVDPGLQILHMGQSGLSLPDRDYYLKDDERNTSLQKDLVVHIAATLKLAGFATDADADARAQAIYAFEKALAELHQPRENLRDPTKIYNRVDRAGLPEVCPELDWTAWLTSLNGAHIEHISLDSKEVFAGVTKLMAATDIAVLKDYMRWSLVRDTADHLPTAIADSHFAYFGKKVTGQEEQSPRWKRCGRIVGDAMGEAIGRKYVDKFFAGGSKETALTLIGDIQNAFEAGLPELSWMDPETRTRAIEKKNTLVNKIGYPEEWTDYSALQVSRDTHAQNVLQARLFDHNEAIARASKPTDRSIWLMPPHLVNAYYHPLLNEMAFPAGILQSPFFDAARPAAMNYGAIGMVMGHELTHGFDDEGSQFDPQGKVHDWWAPEARERFEERTGCVADFYGKFEPIEGMHINGQLTNGENIADIGGLRVAYRAWKARAGENPESVPGLTGEQLFFVSFAQGWCSLAKDEYLQMQLSSDPHSPAKYRVLGTLSQLPEFHEAFNCAEGTPMRPAQQCEVW